MKLHYKGKFSGNESDLPQREHEPGAVRFKEPEMKKFAIIANVSAFVIFIVFAVPVHLRCGTALAGFSMFYGAVLSIVTLYPHELLHALCFKNDVFMYTNFKQGMMFVVGPEDMSRKRFVFMSLLPNIVFGFLPFILCMIFPSLLILGVMGVLCISMGAGDYFNVLFALTQMPKGARTYLCGFHSYWYMPDSAK